MFQVLLRLFTVTLLLSIPFRVRLFAWGFTMRSLRIMHQLVRTALADVAAVEVASSGAVALQQILVNPPDLVLLDLKLPEMSGEELLARLRRTPHVQSVPVVVLSAVTGRDALRAASLDCQGLLSKPLNMQELRRLVEALLSEVSASAV